MTNDLHHYDDARPSDERDSSSTTTTTTTIMTKKYNRKLCWRSNTIYYSYTRCYLHTITWCATGQPAASRFLLPFRHLPYRPRLHTSYVVRDLTILNVILLHFHSANGWLYPLQALRECLILPSNFLIFL